MKILSTSDNHVGFRQYGLLRREGDIEEAFLSILNKGVELGVDVITVSGDIIHTVRPTASSIQFLKICQEYLVEHNLLCLVSIGNHDKSSPHWISNLSTSTTAGFHVLDDETYVLDSVAIYGKTFCSRDEFAEGSCIPRTTDVLLMHQSFNELTTFPSDKSFSFEDFEKLPESCLVFIGDTHIHRKFDRDGRIVCSPGSSELMSESEEADKYVYLSSQTESGWEVESVPLKTRTTLRISITKDEDVEKAIAQIKEAEACEPIVFLKFDTKLSDVLSRVQKQINIDNVVLRPKPIKLVDGNIEEQAFEKDLTFSDLLKDFIPDNPRQFEAVSQLLNPDAEVHSVLDKFVESRLKDHNE